MKISVLGKNDKLSKKEIRQIISFTSNILLGKRLDRHISVVIKNKELGKYEWGYCGPTDYDNRNHRNFTILLNSRASKKCQILTLIHEMVHLKQYARNELKDHKADVCLWLNRQVNINTTEYSDLPWEKEAHESEQVLYSLVMENTKKCRITRD